MCMHTHVYRSVMCAYNCIVGVLVASVGEVSFQISVLSCCTECSCGRAAAPRTVRWREETTKYCLWTSPASKHLPPWCKSKAALRIKTTPFPDCMWGTANGGCKADGVRAWGYECTSRQYGGLDVYCTYAAHAQTLLFQKRPVPIYYIQFM